ncbi:hypothetical protein ACIBCA_20100 [Kitasatospora sp. NPDC051170]|uniref:hypothetical protein n=1 Tax=Kitasatospora sp. NPDC051170 TaxID=3364056 RepID=UPI0037BB3CAB
MLGSDRPTDEPAVFAEMRTSWHRAGELLDPPVQQLSIPYEDIGLPAYLLSPPGRPLRRPTLILVNGSDAQSVDLTIERFRCDDVAHLVTCPTLVLGYETEAMIPGQGSRLFDLLRCPKRHIVLTADQGAGDHCAPMAPQLRNGIVRDWLEQALA